MFLTRRTRSDFSSPPTRAHIDRQSPSLSTDPSTLRAHRRTCLRNPSYSRVVVSSSNARLAAVSDSVSNPISRHPGAASPSPSRHPTASFLSHHPIPHGNCTTFTSGNAPPRPNARLSRGNHLVSSPPRSIVPPRAPYGGATTMRTVLVLVLVVPRSRPRRRRRHRARAGLRARGDRFGRFWTPRPHCSPIP